MSSIKRKARANAKSSSKSNSKGDSEFRSDLHFGSTSKNGSSIQSSKDVDSKQTKARFINTAAKLVTNPLIRSSSIYNSGFDSDTESTASHESSETFIMKTWSRFGRVRTTKDGSFPSVPIQREDLKLYQEARTKIAQSEKRNTTTPFAISTDSTPSLRRPRAKSLSRSVFGSRGTFVATERSFTPKKNEKLGHVEKRFWLNQIIATIISTILLLIIVAIALLSRLWTWFTIRRFEKQPDKTRAWNNPAKYKNEKVTKDVRYYAREVGYDLEEHLVVTKDGYILKLYKVIGKEQIHSDDRGGFPVLIMHGLFQSCGCFITSEERSLAFWLADQGYQVYLGNGRAVFDSGHVKYNRLDPEFWNFNIKELALYDIPTMVDFVRLDSNYDQIAYIGHSQGNATMFAALALVPELGQYLSAFIALAPAVYAGPLTTGFPFAQVKSLDWRIWRSLFGELDYIQVMDWAYHLVPSKIFAATGYQMFAYLFNWTDKNWLPRRKRKMFRFTPSPVSSASIFWWTGLNGFSTQGCLLNPEKPIWFDENFPPLAIHYGDADFLVETEPLLERLQSNEKNVDLIRVQNLVGGEHCDFYWHIDAVELVFHAIKEDIELTRPRYPEELDEKSR